MPTLLDEAAADCVPKLTVAAVLLAELPAGLLKTSMLTVCCSTERVGELTVRVALKWEASLLMLMEVKEVEASLLPAGLPAKATARGVRGVRQPTAALGEAGTGVSVRRGALGLVGRAPWWDRVARGEQGPSATAEAGLQGGVTERALRGVTAVNTSCCCATASSCLCARSRPLMEAL